MKLNGKNNNLILFLAGFLYIIVAVAVLLLPFDDAYFNMLAAAVAICVVGFLLVFSYLINKKWFFKPGWILSQGMFCIIIAILLFREIGSIRESDRGSNHVADGLDLRLRILDALQTLGRMSCQQLQGFH